MIQMKFSPKNTYIGRYSKNYPEVLNWEGKFSIEINNQVIFCEPNFPILEFLLTIDQWMKEDKSNNMYYYSLDTDDNPLISFINCNNKWTITSPWQLYVCNDTFTRTELEESIENLKNIIHYS